jgi:Uma2 family endonuclease
VRQSGIRRGSGLQPADVLLVVEVLSPSNARTDLVLKRHDYAAEGIPAYWIVDPEKHTLTVLEHDGGEHYTEVALISPGETFTTDRPFPISIDIADIF